MNSRKTKKKTIDLIDVMIRHADKGPSGFWTDDYEGCGNPKIFPEFEEGLKHGKYIRKDHYFCPWNTAILYGDGHGNIMTGCYHSCSIRDAKSLSAEMLAAVLTRFKKHLEDGLYDDTKHLKPLLTEKAAALIQKYQDNEYIKELLAEHYGDNTIVLTEIGNLDFSPAGMEDIVSGRKLTYDDYIDIQIQSSGKQRSWFEMCYYNIPSNFKGCIEKKAKKNICFKRIYVSGMYPDGDGFKGKEDHVWMDIQGFEDFKAGESVSFYADVYRYVKTGNGKVLDYSLRNPQDIERIGSYQLPSDDDLVNQSINEIICETCFLSDHCNRTYCLR